MLKALLASVLGTLGKTSFEKNDGKNILTEEDKKTLQSKYGKAFVDKFSEELANYKEDDKSSKEVNEYKEKLEKLQSEYDSFKSESEEREKNLSSMVETLANSPEEDKKLEKGNGKQIENQGGKSGFKPNMNFLHNKVMEDFVNGDGKLSASGETINTDELKKEFGEYVNNVRYDIVHQLFGTLMCTKFMTTKMSEYTEYRASEDVITSVIQQFKPFWTPKGGVKFTPLTIINRKHKINLPIKPSDIMTDVIGYLYDEGLQPKDMPIVKYIINVLLKPMVEEEREELLATGVFEEFNPAGGLKDYIAGQESGKSMDGYCTILKKEKAKAGTKINFFLDGVALTPENIIDKLESFVDSIAPKFKKKAMYMHIDPDLVTMYNRAYQEKFKYAINDDSGRQRIDFSKVTFAPIDGMIGTKMFFVTPKENFIHLLSKNKGASKIWLQDENYDVKVFAEWWESVGFLIAEAVFAYVPPVAPAGSGSAGGQTV